MLIIGLPRCHCAWPGLPLDVRLKAANGEVIATSQGYSSKASAKNGVDSVRRHAAEADIVEVPKED